MRGIMKYKIGDKVIKISGYEFNGTVVCAFKNLKGEHRYVIEHEWGWLMIFNENQIDYGHGNTGNI